MHHHLQEICISLEMHIATQPFVWDPVTCHSGRDLQCFSFMCGSAVLKECCILL
jgi:hypothetical protein